MSRVQELKRQLSFSMQQSRWPECLVLLQKLTEQEEGHPSYYNQMGDLHLKMGDQEAALSCFLRGVKEYSNLSMYPNAAALAKKILRIDPENRAATWMIGEMKTRQGFLADGAEMMLRALRYYAEDPATQKMDLQDLLRQAEQLQGGDREVLELVARSYAQMGDGVQARAVTLRIAEIEEREGRHENAFTLRELAQKYLPDPMAEDPGSQPEASAKVREREAPRAPRPVTVKRGSGGQAREELPQVEILKPGPARAPAAAEEDLGSVFLPELPQIEILSPRGTPIAARGEPEAKPAQVADKALWQVEAQPQPAVPPEPPAPGDGESSGSSLGDSIPCIELQTPYEAILQAPVSPRVHRAPLHGDEPRIPPEGITKKDEVTVGLITTFGEDVKIDDVDAILAEFRSRLEIQFEDISPEERYQLGISYMEMTLYQEALSEFARTCEHPTLGAKTRSLMARCLLALKRPQDAVALMESRLSAETLPQKDSLEFYYLLGLAYEELNEDDHALSCFTKVYQLDVEFRDVKARLENLTRTA